MGVKSIRIYILCRSNDFLSRARLAVKIVEKYSQVYVPCIEIRDSTDKTVSHTGASIIRACCKMNIKNYGVIIWYEITHILNLLSKIRYFSGRNRLAAVAIRNGKREHRRKVSAAPSIFRSAKYGRDRRGQIRGATEDVPFDASDLPKSPRQAAAAAAVAIRYSLACTYVARTQECS